MNIWEAKYIALSNGIEKKEYIENAERIVRLALEITPTTGQPFSNIFHALLDATIKIQNTKESK